jgi:hypothetical protein
MHINYRMLLMISSVFISTSLVSQSAKAEYYLVYPEAMTTTSCGNPCMRESCYQSQVSQCAFPIYYMEFHSPRRSASYGSEEYAPYAWVPNPSNTVIHCKSC